MPGWTSPQTGIVWLDGSDYVDQIDDIFKTTDSQIAQGIKVGVQTVDERNARFPNPGLTQFPTVVVASLAEEHRWTGRSWMVTDLAPKTYTTYWYSVDSTGSQAVLGVTGNPDTRFGPVDLTCKATRDGIFVDWEITMVRVQGTVMGSGYYQFRLPFALATYRSGGWCRGYIANGTDPAINFAGGLTFDTPLLATPTVGNTRVGSATYPYAIGDWITLGGRSRIGGVS